MVKHLAERGSSGRACAVLSCLTALHLAVWLGRQQPKVLVTNLTRASYLGWATAAQQLLWAQAVLLLVWHTYTLVTFTRELILAAAIFRIMMRPWLWLQIPATRETPGYCASMAS